MGDKAYESFEDIFLHAMAEMKDFHEYAEAYEQQVKTADEYAGLLDTVIDDLNASWRQAEQAKEQLDQYIAEEELSINHGSHKSDIESVEAFLHRLPQDELRAYVQETDDETKRVERLLVNRKNLAAYNKTYLQAVSHIYENEPTVQDIEDVTSPEERRKAQDDSYRSIQEQIEEEIETIRGAKDTFTPLDL